MSVIGYWPTSLTFPELESTQMLLLIAYVSQREGALFFMFYSPLKDVTLPVFQLVK